MKKNKVKESYSLTGFFTVAVFLILISAVAILSVTIYLITNLGYADRIESEINVLSIVVVTAAVSLALGAVISVLLANFPLKPVSSFVDHLNRLANGNFKTRFKPKGRMADHPFVTELVDTFNKLAEELENTEILRSDFINNFSHEFKTPIVSIAGLAKLLNKGDLDEQTRKRYLTAIEEESRRLADMSTNVLKLSKIEKQNILTDVSKFNLSEQIRHCILLLENKWEIKNIQFDLKFDEQYLSANEELLREVWINLIDNAIKFSPEAAVVTVEISESEDKIAVSISNTGSEILPGEEEKIFGKFYQSDSSHSSSGNGIGLAIVKKIVELHRGEVSAVSDSGTVTVTAKLPKESNG